MSGLLAEAKSSTGRRRQPCGVARFAATLDEDDRAGLADALADDEVSTNAIHKALAARGLDMLSNAVRLHRKGECACGRLG